MYQIKQHPLIKNDLEKLDHSTRLKVFKKLKQLQSSPKLGLSLGNKNNMDLTGFRKIYVANKKIRIVYEIIDEELLIYTIAIGKRDDMEVYKKASQRKNK